VSRKRMTGRLEALVINQRAIFCADGHSRYWLPNSICFVVLPTLWLVEEYF